MSEEISLKMMVTLSAIAGGVRLLAAFLMYYFGQVRTAILINGLVGFIQPMFFLAIMALGIAAMAGKTSPWKLTFVAAGTLLILMGSR
ncbi:MAG: DUF2619 domain-containing protein [Acidobacteria bacterium]|nr:DUF2619 domain-containing protein [Acidobacteriota bacterium]